MSENIKKLRGAINRRLRVRTGLTTAVEFDEASLGLQAALAAVELEMAALREKARDVAEAFVALNRHCESLNIPITETAWIHGHRISNEDSDKGAALLRRLCDLLGISVEYARSGERLLLDALYAEKAAQ